MLECGFFVATWLERAILRAGGKQGLEMSAEVDAKQLKGRLLKMMALWSPIMKRLQGEVTEGKASRPEERGSPS